MSERYGIELVLDLSECNTAKFNRKDIKSFFAQLCELIGMKPEDYYFWDDYHVPLAKRQTDPKTKGTTAIQFILTSNITIHTLDLSGAVFVNIFSCKEYDTDVARDFAAKFFEAKRYESLVIERLLL